MGIKQEPGTTTAFARRNARLKASTGKTPGEQDQPGGPGQRGRSRGPPVHKAEERRMMVKGKKNTPRRTGVALCFCEVIKAPGGQGTSKKRGEQAER